MKKSKTVILIAKIFENLLKLRFGELLNEDIYFLKHFSSWVRTFIILIFLLSKKVCFFLWFFFIDELKWIVTYHNVTVSFQNSKTGVALKGIQIFENESELANNILITKTGVIKSLSKLVVLWVYSYLSF